MSLQSIGRRGMLCLFRKQRDLQRPSATFFVSDFIPQARWLSRDKESPTSTGMEWRKKQLDKLEKRFSETTSAVVDNDEDLQPMWKEMEGRVTRRRPRTVEEMGGRTGRTNVKKTDEEMWLQEGLYNNKDS